MDHFQKQKNYHESTSISTQKFLCFLRHIVTNGMYFVSVCNSAMCHLFTGWFCNSEIKMSASKGKYLELNVREKNLTNFNKLKNGKCE